VAAVALQEELNHARKQHARASELLERAESDLDNVEQRLVDAEAARRHLLENVASGGDEARRRFASVLETDVLQQLTAAEIQLERLRTDAPHPRQAAGLDQLRMTMKTIEDSLRSLLATVSPPRSAVPLRLADSVRDRLATLKGRTGIEPELNLQLPNRIPDAARSIVFKNVCEALDNVERHAHATRVSVKAAAAESGIEVAVADDGTGFIVAESLYLPGHLGLVAMRERAQLAGGWCRIESEPGAGTTIRFWIPSTI
jgi:signal transduction histidine kinase